jgi:putative tricarboxylic transport membrane protein
MRRLGFATAPAVLGLILGPMAEQNFRQSLVLCRGDFMGYLFSRPISVVLAALTIFSLFFPLVSRVLGKKAAPAQGRRTTRHRRIELC